jgi:exocyst complex protein 7
MEMQVENKVLKGPENDLAGFLAAVDQLQNNVEFFTLNSSLKASDSALNYARGLLNKGMTRLAEEFKALLAQHRFNDLQYHES